MAELAAEEVDLRGDWIVQGDRSVVGNSTEQRIEWLTARKLERIANDSSGWDTLSRSSGKQIAIHVKFPVIPPEAKAKHISGSGIILVYVRPDGTVERAEVAQSSGHKILDDAALAAFSQWQFIPGRLSKVRMPFTFTGNYEKPKKHLTNR